MRYVFLSMLAAVVLSFSTNSLAQTQGAAPKKTDDMHPVVIMKTNMGTIEITLDAEKAPVTVENFLSYVNEGFYDGTIFQRVIPDFMIQGGRYTAKLTKKPTKPPIINEAPNRVPNMRGTIAMARTSVVNSATCQFFINLKDNDFLDHKNRSEKLFGYAVFGEVTKGMEVVDKIAGVKTQYKSDEFTNLPVNPVVIESVKVKK